MDRQLPSTEDYLHPTGQAAPPAAEAPAEATTLPPAGATYSGSGLTPVAVSGYHLETELGRGGMGVVYKAVQLGLNRPVALKMLLNGALASSADVQRFRLEAEAIAQPDHPNIIPVHEVGVQEGPHAGWLSASCA